jgi:hypothetical protein
MTAIRKSLASDNVSENKLGILDTEMRQQKIAELAYYKSENRGFEPGHEVEDWLEAESEV